MKKNHRRVQHLIQQALSACGEDFALEEARASLRRAISTISAVSQKREKRNIYVERFKEEAAKKNTEWWKKITENAKKFAATQLKSPEKPDDAKPNDGIS